MMETYSVLIPGAGVQPPDRRAPTAWLVYDGGAWGLPRFTPPREARDWDFLTANQAIREQLGVPATIRCALRVPEPALPGPLNVYILGTHGQAAPPRMPGRWLTRAELSGLGARLPTESAILAAWLAEADGESLPSLELPWWREGWLDEASQRLVRWASNLGRRPLGPPEQLRGYYTSAVLRLPAEGGTLYLKVVPAALAREVPVTRALAERYPRQVPRLLGAEGAWMLLEEAQGAPPGLRTPACQWEELVRVYGRIQRESGSEIEEWLKLGCLDLRLGSLADGVEDLIASAPLRLRGLPQALAADELQALSSLVPRLKEDCCRLRNYGVPDALEHGDLSAGNVALAPHGPVILDWSHACVTQPFYGFGALFEDDDWFPDRPETLDGLLDVYLEAWTWAAPLDRLREAYGLWRHLRPLFQAAHQSRVVEAYQSDLAGRDCVPETASGASLRTMQWWLASHWRKLLASSLGS